MALETTAARSGFMGHCLIRKAAYLSHGAQTMQQRFHCKQRGGACCRSDALLFFYRDSLVKEQETIIGLLKKRECPEGAKGAARKHMQPLGEKTLVSADTPLLDFIQDDSLDRIVISGINIYGLVTRSDLLKLPVSLLGFALTMHAETLMLNIIRSTRISAEIWLPWVPRHKAEIQSTYDRLVNKRSELDKLELTYITDKSEILGKLATSEDPGLEEFTSYLPEKSFIDQLKYITALRNSSAHTGNTSDHDDILQELLNQLRITHKWIEGIEQWRTATANTPR